MLHDNQGKHHQGRVSPILLHQDFDYANCYFSSGDYYYGMTWFEAGSCCYANHGYPAEIVSQEEHDLVKNRLAVLDGEGAHTSYWLGGQDFFSEGEWRWGSGQAFSFTKESLTMLRMR